MRLLHEDRNELRARVQRHFELPANEVLGIIQAAPPSASVATAQPGLTTASTPAPRTCSRITATKSAPASIASTSMNTCACPKRSTSSSYKRPAYAGIVAAVADEDAQG